jgi:hypothetical protein
MLAMIMSIPNKTMSDTANKVRYNIEVRNAKAYNFHCDFFFRALHQKLNSENVSNINNHLLKKSPTRPWTEGVREQGAEEDTGT